MNIGIAGLGLIGGSLVRALVQHGAAVRGWDADPAVRDTVAGDGFDVAGGLEGLAGCELVVVAVPPEATAEVVAAALDAAPGAVVADTASVKAPVLGALPDPTPERFVAAHPLAGAETAGWGSSSPEIVTGAVWAVCPPVHDAPLRALCRLSAAVELLDGRLVACTPRDHDAAVARTSHVPHVAAQALARSLGNGERPLRAVLSAGGYRDMTRVARSDPALWTEILSANRAEVVAALDELLAELRWYRGALEGGDRAGLRRTWDSAREALDELDAIRWNPGAWEERSFDPAGWDPLLALGREGRAVRRLRMAPGGALACEVAR